MKTSSKVGFLGLVAFAVSATLGGGIFSLPASVADRAPAGIALFAWLVCGCGMFCVIRCFMVLAIKKPELKNGVYTYAEAGFGKLFGYLAAFGYWAAGAAAMASYGMLVAWTLSPLVPAFGAGNTWAAFSLCVCIVLAIFLLASRGIKKSAIINAIGTLAKFIPLAIFIIAMLCVFNPQIFGSSLFGGFYPALPTETLGSAVASGSTLSANVSSSSVASTSSPLNELMSVSLLTLWVFVGVESAVVFSRDAVNQKTVARATSTAFFILFALYVSVSLLPFGFMSREAIAELSTPSTGYLLAAVIGPVGLIIVSCGILIAILFGWLVWAQMQAEMPFSLAQYNSFPPVFKKRNANGACIPGLIASSLLTLGFFVSAILFGEDAWHHIVSLTSTIAGPTYLFSSCYLLKLTITQKELWEKGRIGTLVIALLGAVYGCFILFAAGPVNIVYSLCLLSVSLVLFLWGTKAATGFITLKFYEKVVICCMVLASLLGVLAIALGCVG